LHMISNLHSHFVNNKYDLIFIFIHFLQSCLLMSLLFCCFEWINLVIRIYPRGFNDKRFLSIKEICRETCCTPCTRCLSRSLFRIQNLDVVLSIWWCSRYDARISSRTMVNWL
jgi:hypothetical protein